MPKRNIGWRWHLASFPEITAWQLEVNKSWSCEKLFPSLLPSLLLSSLQRQTPQHVFHILASQFTELLSGRCVRHRPAPDARGPGGERGRGARDGLGPGMEAREPPVPRGQPRRGARRAALKPLFAILPQPVLWQEKLWQQKRNPLRPRYHWQVRTALAAPLLRLARGCASPAAAAAAAAASSGCASHHLLSSRVIVHRWVDLETWWLALWGFGNCLRVVRGSGFICHCSHCEEHFMPREFLAFNRGMCHKVLFLLIC